LSFWGSCSGCGRRTRNPEKNTVDPGLLTPLGPRITKTTKTGLLFLITIYYSNLSITTSKEFFTDYQNGKKKNNPDY